MRPAKCAHSITGLEEPEKVRTSDLKAEPGRRSACSGLEAIIGPKVEAGLSARRIYQDLVVETGFTESYQSVQRFVRKLKEKQPERVWRMECQPGEEAQVDFGLGAPLQENDGGKMRRTWVLRVILSWSRKAYSEAVMRQDTETFVAGTGKRAAQLWRSAADAHRGQPQSSGVEGGLV